MKKILKSLLVLLVTLSATVSFAIVPKVVKYNLTFNKPTGEYIASMISNQTLSGGQIIQSSKFTVVFPGNVSTTLVTTSVQGAGGWSYSPSSVSYNASQTHSYYDWFPAGTTTTPTFTANVEYELFRFKYSGGSCISDIRIFINGTDPTAGGLGVNMYDYKNYFDYINNDDDYYLSNVSNTPLYCPINITGKIWNDANGDKMQGSGELLVDGSGSTVNTPTTVATGANLYVNLANAAGTVIGTAPVNANGTYTITEVPAMTSGLKLQVSATPGVVVITVPPTPVLPGNWVSTGVDITSSNNTALQNSSMPGIIALTTGMGDMDNLNFGIERAPVADPKSFKISNTAFTSTPSSPWPTPTFTTGGITYITQSILSSNTNLVSQPGTVGSTTLSGNDAEDCNGTSSCATGKKFQAVSLNSNTLLYYNTTGTTVIPVTAGTTIDNFDPAKLRIYAVYAARQGYTSATNFGFTYSLIDAAGQVSSPATYALQTSFAPLAVTLLSFDAQKQKDAVALTWVTAAEQNNDHFEIEHSVNAKDWKSIGTVKGHGTTTDKHSYGMMHNNPVNGKNYYRLIQFDLNGEYTTSDIRTVSFDGVLTTQLSVYPNPAAGSLFLAGGNGSSATIYIFNATGALTLKKEVMAGEQIDISNLAAGMYEVRMQQGENLSREKVSVIR